MADISKYISAIKNAPTGAEMRKPIANALKEIDAKGKDVDYLTGKINYSLAERFDSFSEGVRYNKNDIVVYDGYKYKFVKYHLPGPWDATQMFRLEKYYDVFSELVNYKKGDIVIYEVVAPKGEGEEPGIVLTPYICIADHKAGPWDPNHFNLESVITSDRLIKKKEFTLYPLDPQMIKGSGQMVMSGYLYLYIGNFDAIDWSVE